MKLLFQRLFRRDNIIVLILVIAATLSIFEIPQQFGVSETKIILIMLGFLAIDSLLEKIGYLETIDTRTKRIEHIIISHPNAVALQTRQVLQPFSERILGVKNVFIFAISANALVMQNTRIIENARRTGTNFRFLLASPDNPALRAASLSSPSSANIDTQVQWINDTVKTLKTMAKTKARGKLELRLYQGVPTTSLIGYDPRRDTGWIQVEPHVYRQAPASRPLFIVQASSRSEWFDFYRDMIAELWEDGQEVALQ